MTQSSTPGPTGPAKITSVDRAELAQWRFKETNGFVVKDYTSVTEDGQEPMIMVIKSCEIFELLADAAAQGRKISVYAIGPCILDQT